MKERNPLTERIIRCCFKFHTGLGPGFNEKIYHNALKLSLREEGLVYETEKEYEVPFIDKRVGKFRVDLIIEDKVIVEIKSFNGKVPPIFESQLLSYLKASGLQTGLLVNFGNKGRHVKRLIYKSAKSYNNLCNL